MTIAAVNRGEWGAQMERADVQEWSCEGGGDNGEDEEKQKSLSMVEGAEGRD